MRAKAMIIYDLVCASEHRFEGWFGSADDFDRQREATLVRCPICDDAAIERRPSINVQFNRPQISAAPTKAREGAPNVAGGEGQMLKMVRQIVASSDNVGSAFAEEARKIHYEEVPQRAIRGQATQEEAAQLRDEGIDFMSLPPFLTSELN
jgi:hypothetical protein